MTDLSPYVGLKSLIRLGLQSLEAQKDDLIRIWTQLIFISRTKCERAIFNLKCLANVGIKSLVRYAKLCMPSLRGSKGPQGSFPRKTSPC